MKINYAVKDLLTAPREYYIAHGISGDCSLGAGVAKQLDVALGLKKKLLVIKDSLDDSNNLKTGTCYFVNGVLNLVDKDSTKDAVTYTALYSCFESMKEVLLDEGITKVAMPMIACGHDHWEWGDVLDILFEVFDEDDFFCEECPDFEILVCVLDEEQIPVTDSGDKTDACDTCEFWSSEEGRCTVND